METAQLQEALEKLKSTKEEEQRKLDGMRDNKSAEWQSLSAESAALLAKSKNLREAIVALSKRNAQLQGQLSEGDGRLREFHLENERLQREVSELSKANSAHQRKVATLEQERKAAVHHETEYQAELAIVHRDIEISRMLGGRQTPAGHTGASELEAMAKLLKEKVAKLEAEQSKKQEEVHVGQKKSKELRDTQRESQRKATATISSLQTKLSEALAIEASLFVALKDSEEKLGEIGKQHK
jgi:chromosome segregation ATPase